MSLPFQGVIADVTFRRICLQTMFLQRLVFDLDNNPIRSLDISDFS